MKNHTIQCPHCSGTGKTQLEREHERTLKAVERFKRPVKAIDILPSGISINAVQMRLLRLEKLRLVKRAGKDGRFILWEAVKK